MSAISGERVRESIPDYLRSIAGVESGMQIQVTDLNDPVLAVIKGALRKFNPHLRTNIDLDRYQYYKMSDRVGQELALLASRQRLAKDDEIGAAHLFWAAAGAEREAGWSLGKSNPVQRAEAAALQIIYTMDAVDAVKRVSLKPQTWLASQMDSLKGAFILITRDGRVEPSKPTQEDRTAERIYEAYQRGKALFSQRR